MTLARHLGGTQFDERGNVLIPGTVGRGAPTYIRQAHTPGAPATGALFIHRRADGSRTMTCSPGCAAGVPDRDGNAVCGCGGW